MRKTVILFQRNTATDHCCPGTEVEILPTNATTGVIFQYKECEICWCVSELGYAINHDDLYTGMMVEIPPSYMNWDKARFLVDDSSGFSRTNLSPEKLLYNQE